MKGTDALIQTLIVALEPVMKQAVKEALPEAIKGLNMDNSKLEEDICFVEEASELTGLAKATLYVKSSRGEIPVFKRGKRLYFSKKDLREWLRKDKE